MRIRRFEDSDAEALSHLVRRNFLEVNIRDYTLEEMERLVRIYTPDRFRTQAEEAHMYVALDGETPVGTGTIASYWGRPTKSILLTIFVLPEYHGTGVGKAILQALEEDEYFLRAERVEVPASITACGFYEKMGYRYKDGKKQLDEDSLYRMEKFPLTVIR